MIRIQKFRIYLHVKMRRKNLCESKYVKRKKKTNKWNRIF